MKLERGGEEPPLTEVVLKTYTNKDFTIIDKRAKSLVKKAEELAISRSQPSSITEEGSCSTPSSQDITAAYIETAKNKKGRVYGLGPIQYLQVSPKDNAASLLRHAESQTLMTAMQGDIGVMKEGMSAISTMKDDIGGLKAGVVALLTLNGVDPVTYQPIAHRESEASAPSPRSETSQHNNNIVSSANNNIVTPAAKNNIASPAANNNSPINLANATPHSISFSE